MASGRVRLAVKCLAAVLATACCAFPRFTSFANQEPDDSEGSHRIDPPRTEDELGRKGADSHEREPPAGHALDRIGSKHVAAERVRNVQFAS